MVVLKKSMKGIGNDIWHLRRQDSCETLEISVALRQEY